MIDQAYRVPLPTLGLTARLIVSEREHPREAQPDLGDLFVHVKVPPAGLSDRKLVAIFDECLEIFERKKKLGLLYKRPARITISRLGVYMRNEHAEPFTLDLMLALFTALADHLDRTGDPGGDGDDSGVEDSESSSEPMDSEDPPTYKEHDRSGSGKVPHRQPADGKENGKEGGAEGEGTASS